MAIPGTQLLPKYGSNFQLEQKSVYELTLKEKMDKMKEEVELGDFETKISSDQLEDIYIKQENECIDCVTPTLKLEPQDMGEDTMRATVVKYENNVCEHHCTMQTINSHAMSLDKSPEVRCRNCSVFLYNISESEENKDRLQNNFYKLVETNFSKSDEAKFYVQSDEIFCNIPKSEGKCNMECVCNNLQITLKVKSDNLKVDLEDLNEEIELFCRKCNILFCNPSEHEEHGCELWCGKCNILFCNPSESEEHTCELWCGKCNILFCSPSECDDHECMPAPVSVGCNEQSGGEVDGGEQMENKGLQCDLCKMTFNMESELDLHISTHNIDNSSGNKENDGSESVIENVDEYVPLWCENCNVLFCNALESKEHDCSTNILEEQSSLETEKRGDMQISAVNCLLSCNLCNISLNSESELDTHMETHNLTSENCYSNDNLLVTNKNCNFPDDLSESDEHENDSKSPEVNEDNLVCNFCNISLNSQMELYVHLEGHKKFSCDVCHKSYTYKCNLVTHMASHTGDRPFQCNLCNKTYSYSSNLVAHMRTHTGERPYRCEVCNKTFPLNQTLTQHMLIHTGERPFQCDTCRKLFSCKKVLMKHMLVHSGLKPFPCKLCNVSFARKASLRSHQRVHTGDRPFTCTTCNKSFAYASCLRVHKRIHTGNYPYQCVVCGKSFSQKSNLYSHMYIHSEDRPFNCIVCNKGFRRKDDLKRHSIIHTDRRSFPCTVCNKAFRRKQHLTRHMDTHNEGSSLPGNLAPTDFLKKEFYEPT